VIYTPNDTVYILFHANGQTGATMIQITMKSQEAIDNNSLPSINTVTDDVLQAQTIHSLNTRKCRSTRRPLPPLRHTVQKGQKTVLTGSVPFHTIKACLGWNTANPQCDVDVSAFLLDSTGKVPGDAWFVFYGQTESPDHSTRFAPENSADRESISIRLDKLNPSVKKIVFVLTIHEALEKKLHFGMVQDAYVRILNADNQEELVSFKMDEYYTNVISMMIGEVYNHNGTWKFNAIGNGVAKDLSGLCALYGVQVDD